MSNKICWKKASYLVLEVKGSENAVRKSCSIILILNCTFQWNEVCYVQTHDLKSACGEKMFCTMIGKLKWMKTPVFYFLPLPFLYSLKIQLAFNGSVVKVF